MIDICATCGGHLQPRGLPCRYSNKPVMRRVLQYIGENPGALLITLDLLMHEGYTSGNIRRAARLLADIGRVRVESEGKERRHYLVDASEGLL